MSNLKIGIFGVGRGVDLARDFINNGCDIVALCDTRRDKMEEAAQRLGLVGAAGIDTAGGVKQ